MLKVLDCSTVKSWILNENPWLSAASFRALDYPLSCPLSAHHMIEKLLPRDSTSCLFTNSRQTNQLPIIYNPIG